MRWELDRTNLPAYIRVNTSGQATLSDYVAMWDEVLASDFWRPGMNVLLDNQKLKPARDMETFTIGRVEYFISRDKQIGPASISAISPNDENYSYARQLQYGLRLRGS